VIGLTAAQAVQLHTAPARYSYRVLQLNLTFPDVLSRDCLTGLPRGNLFGDFVPGVRKDLAMDKKRMDHEGKEDLLLYLESLLRCVDALHTSVGEVMADVVTMRNAILEDQQELTICRSGKRPVKESGQVLDHGMYADASYTDLMMEIASTQQYEN
jgi:hypothetical protein